MAELTSRLAAHGDDIRRVIEHYFNEKALVDDFVKLLNEVAPPSLEEFYHDDPETPGISEDAIGKAPLVIVRPTCFAWSVTDFTIKDSLGTTVLEIIGFILADGCLTHRQPILVTQPSSLMDPMLSSGVSLWSLADFKGQTRCLTLLGLLQTLWAYGVPKEKIAAHVPKLLPSIAAVAVYHVPQTTVVSSILSNARIGARDGVRRAWNMVQWANALLLLQSKCAGSGDAQLCIRQWHVNSQAQLQIGGAKRQALNNILVMSKEAADNILATVGIAGWRHAPYTEDWLASKRLRVGCIRTAGPKTLHAWTTVTEKSFVMLIAFYKRQTLETHPDMRRTVARAALEDTLLMMSFACHVGAAIQERIAIPPEDLQIHWYDKIIAGESSVAMELTGALHDKSSTFDIGDVIVVRAIIQKFSATKSDGNLDAQVQSIQFTSRELEEK